jgi:hypothetical protein
MTRTLRLFARRQARGRLPAGTVSASLTLSLATTRTNWDGSTRR